MTALKGIHVVPLNMSAVEIIACKKVFKKEAAEVVALNETDLSDRRR